MTQSLLLETFDRKEFDPSLRWFCEPERWRLENSCLIIEPDAQTDFWQRTHYGFTPDNGHFLYREVEGNFTLSTHLRFYPANQYDQAGLMVRVSSQCWLKTSVEYEPEGPSKLGVVVTNRGYSDWSTQNYPAGVLKLALRVRREGEDYLVEYLEPSTQEAWTQIRMAHLDSGVQDVVKCGLYACSPIAAGFRAEFEELIIVKKD
jgi:regulation of enolase protein 1 (concanavalin A-like superfamily)